MVVMAIPDTPQHMKALALANRTRFDRAKLKREVRAGERTAASVILNPPPEAMSMTLFDLLTAQHRWGRGRARRLLVAARIGERKQVGALTDRQREGLATMLVGPPLVDVPPPRRPVRQSGDLWLASSCPVCDARPGESCMVIRKPQPWNTVVTDRPRKAPHPERPRV